MICADDRARARPDRLGASAGGFLQRIGGDHFYPSVDEAVRSVPAPPNHTPA
jgi:hypothetical protein